VFLEETVDIEESRTGGTWREDVAEGDDGGIECCVEVIVGLLIGETILAATFFVCE
jgi:hypothetical protein